MKNYEPGEVTLSEIPADIDLKRIQLNKNQCQDNAYKTTRDYDYTYVEGVIILVDHDNGTRAAAHAWNESKAGHFDLTTTLWVGEAYKEIKGMKNIPVVSYESNEMPQGGIDFSPETHELVDFLNSVRDWKFKPKNEVVLKDPINGKPVAAAVISGYDPEIKVYDVNILRLNNSIPFTWPENNIEKATPPLIEQSEIHLAELELAADLMISSLDIKDKSVDDIIQFTIDVPAYTVYYKQLNIGGATKWRLLTMKSIPAKKK